MSMQSNQFCIEEEHNQADSMLILCQLHQEIRGRRDKKLMRLLAAQFVQSLRSVYNSDSGSSHCKSLINKANELLMNVQNGNYALSMTMTGHLLDSLAHGIRPAEYNRDRKYLQ